MVFCWVGFLVLADDVGLFGLVGIGLVGVLVFCFLVDMLGLDCLVG